MPDTHLLVPSSLQTKHPLATRILYQLLLTIVTFECVLSIARYDPDPAGGPIRYPPSDGSNSTTEHICKISAHEVDVPVGFLQYIIPNFILCPTTLTLVGICVIFVVGICKLYSFVYDAPFSVVPTMIIITLINAEGGKGFWVYLQMNLPAAIWVGVTLVAVFHPLLVWLLPGSYGMWTERGRREREERLVARLKRRAAADVEAGGMVEDEETPLTGRGFVRDRNGALVENPATQAQVRDLYEEIRSGVL